MMNKKRVSKNVSIFKKAEVCTDLSKANAMFFSSIRGCLQIFWISLMMTGIFASSKAFGQILIPNTNTVNENFDGMGTTTTAALPSNWKMSPAGGGATATWTNASNFTAVSQGASSGTPTAGGRYNWGNSLNTTDRALGVMTSGTYASSNSIMAFFRNTNSLSIQSLTIGYTLERYRVNTAAASVNFSYSLDGTSWTAVSAGNIAAASLPTGTSAYNFNPSGSPSTANTGVVTMSGITINGLGISNNANFYLRWELILLEVALKE